MGTTKISSYLGKVMRTRPAGEKIPIIVRIRPDVPITYALEAGLTTRRAYRIIPAHATAGTSDDIQALAARPEVEHIWPDLLVHTMLDVSVPLIQTPLVWQAGCTGQGIKVGVVDTGADIQHPDLAGRILATADFSGEGFRDNNGHGTHVASIAAGSGQASGGRYKGVAPGALLLAAKVLRQDGSGMMSDVIAGLEWALEQGAQVINLSLGGPPIPGDGNDALSVACDAVVSKGTVVCVAAGNSGPAGSTVSSPGAARQVITIGASTKQDGVADFSSRGPTLDGRAKPDVCFPGVDIVAARAQGTSMGHVVDNFYTRASGTSMATPHATGTVALLLQARPDLTPAQVKSLLMQTAKNLNLAPNTQGAGRADAYAAYQNTPLPPLPPPELGCLPMLRRMLGIQPPPP
jgi:serine protease AprX